jgi:hypothetical protein
MVNHCANPQCCKPLHYLREGRVYVFDVTRPAANGERTPRRMEHFWLCGACSEIYLLEQVEDRTVRISARPKAPITANVVSFKAPHTIAS